MFNSKFFCIVIVLTTIALGAAVFLQVQEMMEYDLLAKLDKKYLSGTFTGEPAEAKEETKEEDTEKKDDKK